MGEKETFWDNECRDWANASKSQGMPKISSKGPAVGERNGTGPPCSPQKESVPLKP